MKYIARNLQYVPVRLWITAQGKQEKGRSSAGVIKVHTWKSIFSAAAVF